MNELYKYIGSNIDVPAGDIGVGKKEIGYMFGQYKKITNEFTGVLTGKPISLGGSLGRIEATGFGLCFFTNIALKNLKNTSFEGKKVLYERVQELAHRFEAVNGSIVCRELLGLAEKSQEPTPEQRSDKYYKKRPCKELVGCAAEILEDFLEEVKSPLQ